MADRAPVTAHSPALDAQPESFTPTHARLLPITDSSQVPGARHAAIDMSRRAGFSETQGDKAALIATELGTNVIKHGAGGEMHLQVTREAGIDVLEILTVDKGPGIANAFRCLSDGYSTSGSPGTGLGAIRRLSDGFDLYSQAGRGTIVLSRVFSAPPSLRAPMKTLEMGAVSRPKPGEEICGDHWGVVRDGGRWQFLVADGLGHGPLASEAALQAARLFGATRSRALPDLLEVIHAGLRPTRGAAVAVAHVDLGEQLVRFAGLGNIGAAIVSSGRVRSMVSLNGTAGVEMRKVSEFTYPWSDDALLILHSDGLASHWDLEQYPGLSRRHPTVIAAVLYRDHDRGRDDVTVVVAKERHREFNETC